MWRSVFFQRKRAARACGLAGRDSTAAAPLLRGAEGPGHLQKRFGNRSLTTRFAAKALGPQHLDDTCAKWIPPSSDIVAHRLVSSHGAILSDAH